MRGAGLLRVSLAAAALAAGCAHGPPPLGRVPLVFDRPRKIVRPFVRASVAGRPVLLLVDTGAFQSMLPSQFARENGLRARSRDLDEYMIDANGNSTRMPLVSDVPVQFEGEASGGKLDFRENTSGLGGLILAPQDLVRPGWALVIDLAAEALSYEREDAAVTRLRAAGAAPQELPFESCRQEGFFNDIHRVVSTTVNGVPARMMIDTGSDGTVLARNHPALPSMSALLGDRGTVLATGSVGRLLRVEGVPIVFAGTSFVVPAMVLPSSHTCWDGIVGMDVLRHCTLVWGSRSLWTACRAETTR